MRRIAQYGAVVAVVVAAVGMTACEPAPKVKAVQVAVTTTHGCAVMVDHTVRCWGNNRDGQLGDGTASGVNTDSHPAVKVKNITNAKQVAVGSFFSCALLTTGGVDCWGLGSHGRLGNGGTASHSVPVHVTGITNATSIGANNGAAYNGACVSLATGEVKCWGSNYEGVLGTTSIPTQTSGNTGAALTPVTADGITNATQVAAGFSNACARLADGSVKCWGRNASKVLGDDSLPAGGNSYIPTPTTVVGLTGATSVSVGSGRACAMRAAGAVCWGGGSATPTAISGDPGFTQVSSTSGGCGIKAGVESCWGPNDMHQVGNKDIPTGSQIAPYRATTPVPVSGLPAKVASMGTSFYDSCAVLTTGAVWCWGYDVWGALGTGTNTQGDGTGATPLGRLPKRVANI